MESPLVPGFKSKLGTQRQHAQSWMRTRLLSLPSRRLRTISRSVAEPREPEARAQEEPSREDGRRPRTFEILELVGLLLVTSVYPIVSGLVSGADPPIAPRQLIASIFWFVG